MPDRSAWPPHVQPISMSDLDHLGIDVKHNLYWDGVAVVTDAKFVLSTGQRIAAIVIGLAAILGGLGGFVQGWVAYDDWACKLHLYLAVCS
jgi:hypothetical protein